MPEKISRSSLLGRDNDATVILINVECGAKLNVRHWASGHSCDERHNSHLVFADDFRNNTPFVAPVHTLRCPTIVHCFKRMEVEVTAWLQRLHPDAAFQALHETLLENTNNVESPKFVRDFVDLPCVEESPP